MPMAVKSRTRKRPVTPAKRKRGHPIGIRLTPAMKAELDEVALEWRTTRAAVIRELMEHALKTHPRRQPSAARKVRKSGNNA